jgi:hypothetical protein
MPISFDQSQVLLYYQVYIVISVTGLRISRMSPIAAMDVCQNESVKNFEAAGSMFEIDSEFLRLSDKPRPINVERKRSFDERSFSENSFRIIDHLENLSPAGRRSGFNTPRSCGFESHPMVVDAWESLRRTLVYFRSQPVGTIAALDHSVEELNYDQVNSIPFSFCSF